MGGARGPAPRGSAAAPLAALIGCIALAGGGAAGASELPARAHRVLAHYGIADEAASVYVHEVGAPAPAFVHLPDAARTPASTMKLLTTYAALELLGPAYRWRTRVFADGEVDRDGVLHGDLVLQAGGDPYLVAERLWLLQRRLRLAGVREITGDLVFEEGFFTSPPGDTGDFDGQPWRTYNVKPADLLMNFQSVVFRFEPDVEARRVIVRTDPQVHGLEIDNRLRLIDGPCRGYQRGVAFDAHDLDGELKVVFSGAFPAGCRAYAMRRALRATHAYNYGVFKALWEETGGRLAGRFRVRPAPQEIPEALRQPLLTFPSPSLSEVVRSVNKYSNNVMARHLLLTLGAEHDGKAGSVAAGVRAVREWLAAKGIDDAGLVIDNGAGLSRDARISARQLGEILLAASDSLYASEFIASMPLSAMDGTLEDRFRRDALAGRLHMKTGSLDHVSSVAGFATTVDGREYVIVVFVNADDAHRGPGEEFEEAIVDWVMRTRPGRPVRVDCPEDPALPREVEPAPQG